MTPPPFVPSGTQQKHSGLIRPIGGKLPAVSKAKMTLADEFVSVPRIKKQLPRPPKNPPPVELLAGVAPPENSDDPSEDINIAVPDDNPQDPVPLGELDVPACDVAG